MRIGKRFSFLLAVAAGVCWGTYGTFATFMGNMGMEEATVSLISPLFLMVFFFILVMIDDRKKIKVRRGLLPALLFYGFVGAMFNYSIVQAYKYLPLGIVSTIVFCNLFLIMIFSFFMFKDKITWQKGIAAALAVLGIAMVLNVFALELTWSLIGVAWTLLATVGWALMVTCEKFLLVKEVDGNTIMTYMGMFSVLFISILSPPWDSTTKYSIDRG